MATTWRHAPDPMVGKLYNPGARQVFLGIYNNLQLTSGDSPRQSILVCAANPHEGASMVALGVALAAAEQNAEPVLLVDGNFHYPHVCEAFGQMELFGLGDLMSGKLDQASAIRPTTVPAMHVLGAGVVQPNHLQNLENPKFRDLLQGLKSLYKLIVVDGPAVNFYPESVVYASQVDRVLLVVYAGQTRSQVVQTALSRLTQSGCDDKKIELVLNRRTFPIPKWLYKKL